MIKPSLPTFSRTTNHIRVIEVLGNTLLSKIMWTTTRFLLTTCRAVVIISTTIQLLPMTTAEASSSSFHHHQSQFWGLLFSPSATAAGGGRNNEIIDLQQKLPRAAVESILDEAWKQAGHLLERDTAFPMDYGLFRGVSALRSLSSDERDILDPSRYGDGTMLPNSHLESSSEAAASFYRFAALRLLLLRGNLGAAHEVLLGVTTPDNTEEAEFAATHPGQTPWAANHPQCFTDTSDYLHMVLHRLEGPHVGEGNHTGYENAQHWALGGPKQLAKPAFHPVRAFLAQQAPDVAPLCCNKWGLLGGNTDDDDDDNRTWDDLAMIELCRLRHEGQLSRDECTEVVALQRLELCSLLYSELARALGVVSSIENQEEGWKE